MDRDFASTIERARPSERQARAASARTRDNGRFTASGCDRVGDPVVHNLHGTTLWRGTITMSLRSLQSRILALFLLVVVGVQVGAFVLVNTVGGAAARNTIGEELVAGARVFDRLLEEDTQRLVQGARVLAADYAFREAIATRDRETIRSALVNHGKRIDADVMMLIGLDDRVIANTLDVGSGREVLLSAADRRGANGSAGSGDGGHPRPALSAGDRAGDGARFRSHGSPSASMSTMRLRRICVD